MKPIHVAIASTTSKPGEVEANLCGYDGRTQYHLGHGTILNPMGEVAALIHGLPNLDRQRPMYTHAVVDVSDTLPQ